MYLSICYQTLTSLQSVQRHLRMIVMPWHTTLMQDQRPRILLVEDDTILANLLVTQFQNDGIECLAVVTGEDALKYLGNDHNIDLIFLDISLPGIDGFEVLSHLKNDAALAPIPVVIISNFSQEKDIAWGKKLGAVRFVSKISVVPADIVAIAWEYIGKHDSVA